MALLPRLLALILVVPATGFALDPAAAPAPRHIQVLFFGDDDHHQPLERYRMFKEVSGGEAIDLTYEKRMEALNPENLAKYDILLIYANHQQITPGQLAAVQGFIEHGGGFVPVHCGSACFKKTDGYISLVGGQIEGHGEGVFTPRVVAPDHPVMKGYTPFESWDETYRHHRLSDDITILERREDEPWTWVRQQGRGRVFYTASGHDERCWLQPGFQDLLVRGIRWAAGDSIALLQLPPLEYRTPMLPPEYKTDKPVPKVQEPLTPQESMLRAQVPAGFELSLFASEPEIVRPIAMTWDERGRLWVVETLDYPNGLHTGDTGHDLIKICEDTDGDGKADKFTVFATGLSIATSLVHANGGVIVSDGPRMLFLKDTNGDDVADERRVLFSGFRMHDTHAGTSNLRYGFDGWIYATDGYAGFDGEVGGKAIKFDTGVYRFRPDGSALEFLGKTTNNTWGLGFTPGFDVLGSTANRQAAWQLIGDGIGNTRRADRGTRIYPVTQDVQGSDGWDPPVEILGDGRIRAKSRNYTAAAGYGIYSSDRFPEEWRDRTAFVCEPTGHLVSLGHMHTENADFTTDFDGNNLYASSDAWSAPVMAETGPDGAVWVADWYNIIVQHLRPGAPFEQTKVTRGPGSGYLTPLREHPMGRIYRIYPKGSTAAVPKLNADDAASLIAGLRHPALPVRLQAQRLLVEHGHRDAKADLIALAKEPTPGSLNALWALKGLGLLDSLDPAPWLRDPLALHRRGILQVWSWPQIPELEVTKEPDPFVVREWLLAVAKLPEDEALGRRLRDWHRNAQQLRRGEVLDRCFAAAAARHASGFLLASLENAPDPSVLQERIYPAAIAAFGANHSPAVLAAAQKTPDAPLAKALLDAAATKAVVEKKFNPPAERLSHGENVYAATCAACHQVNGGGVDLAFPPLDGSARALGNGDIPIRIVLHGLTGPVEPKGHPAVNSLMPPLATLSDAEIADVLTYVRHQWSNDAAPVSAGEVTKVRTANKDRQAPWTAAELK